MSSQTREMIEAMPSAFLSSTWSCANARKSRVRACPEISEVQWRFRAHGYRITKNRPAGQCAFGSW